MLVVKNPACRCRRRKRRGFDPWVVKIPLEEGMATDSNILAWRIPRTEEPGGCSPTTEATRHSLSTGLRWVDRAVVLRP